MTKLLLISGANRGLGKAIANIALKQNDTVVVSVSRSVHVEHEKFLGNKFHFIKTDLSKGFSSVSFTILNELISANTHLFFVNNAGIIIPINSVGNFEITELNNSINVNVTFPVSLINYLIHTFQNRKINFVNISSGAANNAIANWSLYCASKAYMKIFFEILKEENKLNPDFSFFNIEPGTLDTDMQNDIRGSKFPRQNYFQELKSTNKLTKPEDAANKILKEVKFIL